MKAKDKFQQLNETGGKWTVSFGRKNLGVKIIKRKKKSIIDLKIMIL